MYIYGEKPTFFSDLLHQLRCPPPLDAQWIIIIIKKQNKTRVLLDGGWAEPGRPIPREEGHIVSCG